MRAIISTAINFQNAADVAAYLELSPQALPDGDREYTEVTRYIVGYAHIILLGANGRTLAKVKRQDVKALVIEGEPICIRGDGFQRIDCYEDPDGRCDETTAQYMVWWCDHDGSLRQSFFRDRETAEREEEALLKEYDRVGLVARVCLEDAWDTTEAPAEN